MRHNVQILLSVLILAITLISPLKGRAQELSVQDTISIEKQSAHKWYNYLWQHLLIVSAKRYHRITQSGTIVAHQAVPL